MFAAPEMLGICFPAHPTSHCHHMGKYRGPEHEDIKMHEEIKGIRCSLVLFNWVPVTGLILLNTPNSPPANTFPPDAVP